MIAYRCHFEPTNLKAVDLIRTGAIGQVQAIETAFGFNERAGEWRLDKKLSGGGPLMDVGIYSLNATRYLTGEEPTSFAAFSSVIDQDGRFTSVEENLSWTMKFPSGIVASCATTYGAQMGGFFKVHGAKGWIGADPAFNYDGQHLHAEYFNGPRFRPPYSTKPTRKRIPISSRPRPITSPTASRTTSSPKLRARRACATCATSPKSTATAGISML